MRDPMMRHGQDGDRYKITLMWLTGSDPSRRSSRDNCVPGSELYI